MMRLKMVIHLIFIGIFLSISSLGADSFKKAKDSTIVLSKRSVTSKAKISGLYVAYFNRAADKKGLDFWEDKSQKALDRGENVSDVLKELSADFAKHPTFISTYKNMNNREFVEAIYKNTLGRAGDEEGIVHWINYLNSGNNRSDMVSDFVELSLTLDLTPENFPTLTAQELAVAQERQDLITNKVKVALSFTTLLDEHTNVANSQYPENDPAYKASIKILSNITEDNSTVSTAIDFLNSIKDDDDPINRINNPTKTKGYLIDSPLQGVTYVCDDNEGLTDANGMFECANPPVTFKIGGLTLGTLTEFTADGKVYPQDLLGLARTNFTDSRLKLLARLLQSLDDDGDIGTKITITESVRSGITTTQEFKDMSQSDVQSLLSGLGKSLVKECGALEHLGDKSVSCGSDGGYYVDSSPVSTPTPTPTQTYSLKNGNHALMGPLKGATVKVYKLSDLDNAIEEVKTDNLGKFDVTLNGVADTEMLLVAISGGMDVDANDDGVLDDVPTENKGTIHGFAKASELKNGNVNVTLLSEVLYYYVKHLIGKVHQDDLEQAMNRVSVKLLKENINRNAISYKDINNFIPIDNESKKKLNFDYSKLIGKSSFAHSIYNDGNLTVIENILKNNFGSKLTLNDTTLILEKKYFKINMLEPIKSTVTSVNSSIFINRENNTSKLSDFVLKDSNLSFTLTTNDDVEIIRWDGCDKVSNDLSTCYLYNIQEDKLVIPTVSYKETVYADNVKDLTGFYTTVADDNITYTISLDLNDSIEKRTLVESIVMGDIIINTSDSQRFFRKVNSITKLDNYNFNIITSDVSFLELYKQGSASLNRELTHEDLAENINSINRSLRIYGNVRLLPPTKPNDNIFVLEFGKSSSNNKSMNRAIEFEESEAFQLTDNVNLEGKLSFKLDADFSFNTSWSYLLPTLDSMRFAIKNEIKSELKIIATTELADFSREKQIGRALRFRIPVPSSPIWVDATLTFYIGGTGKVEGIVTVGGEAGVNTKIGFNYANGHISPIGSFSPNGKFLGTGEVKFSTGAYLKSLPSLTVFSIAGMGIDNRLGIYAESSIVNGYSTSGSECDIWKGKAYAQFSTGPVFTWDPWLRDFDWAKKIEKDVNAEYSRSSSMSWVLKEWSNPCTENPSYLDITGEDIEENIIGSEGIDKSYTYIVKNLGDTTLNWKVEKIGTLSDIITISPTSGTLSKDESMEVLVVLSNSDMTEYTGSTQNSYLKFINNSEDSRTVLEKGGKTFTISVNTEADLVAPVLNFASLTGDSIKKVDFGWDYEGRNIDGFKMYKSNCTDDFELLNVMQEPSKRNLSLMYENIASSLVAGESYCFKISSYKNGVESDLSNQVILSIPEYAILKSNITDKNNNPIENARVYLTSITTSTQTDGSGDYTFEKLLPGIYKIVVEADGYIRQEALVTIEAGETKIFERQLVAEDNLEGVEGTIGGKVQNALNGSGVSGATIEIRKGINILTGEIVNTIITDNNGNYSTTLETGAYTFSISANGYTSTSATINVFGNESRQKDLSLSPILSEGNMRIVLNWGENPSDLDSHLVKKVNGSQEYHIYYAAQSGTNGDNLDHDDVTSYGPETVTINNVDTSAVYTYYVHHYAGSSNLKSSSAKVDVYYGSHHFVYSVPNGDGIYWKVFEIINGEVTPCTSNCMGSSTPLTRALNRRNISSDAYLFDNLPPKE